MRTVKLIIIMVLYLAVSQKVEGQNIPNYDFYIGTWVYESGNEKFTMKTKSFSYSFKNEMNYVLLGTFRYEKNGTVVFDNLNKLTNAYMDDGNYKVVLANEVDLPSNQTHSTLRFRLVDPITGFQTGRSQVQIISTSPPKISWTMKEDEGTYDMDEGFPVFVIPMNMVLTKVE